LVKKFTLSTNSKTEFIEITPQVERIVKESGVKEGICWVFAPHTTAGITINEGADPSVRQDILNQLTRIVPFRVNYLHLEGNSPAHIKSSIIGVSEAIIIERGKLVLGTWQSLYFCEFDGPRHRQVIVKVQQ